MEWSRYYIYFYVIISLFQWYQSYRDLQRHFKINLYVGYSSNLTQISQNCLFYLGPKRFKMKQTFSCQLRCVLSTNGSSNGVLTEIKSDVSFWDIGFWKLDWIYNFFKGFQRWINWRVFKQKKKNFNISVSYLEVIEVTNILINLFCSCMLDGKCIATGRMTYLDAILRSMNIFLNVRQVDYAAGFTALLTHYVSWTMRIIIF